MSDTIQTALRNIALYLPQYHPIPENDAWWGTGFTEWRNVCKAGPLFTGHYQPHLPSDLGYYDLRLEESRLAQEGLAKEFGIHGFCYYHYWFNGHRLLEKPLDMKLANTKENLPFMMCWANENWTRRWDGKDKEILLEQKYSQEDDRAHIRHLLPYFKDERYIRVDNKAVFIVYKPWLLSDPEQTAIIWREEAQKMGIELYLMHMVFGYNPEWQQKLEGFDAVLDFEPFGIRRNNFDQTIRKRKEASRSSVNRLTKFMRRVKDKNFLPEYTLNLFPYEEMGNGLSAISSYPFKIFPSLVPGWDNTARRGNNPTLILKDASPQHFENWLDTIKKDFKPYSEQENFIFINAWNEWAEGNHLEPCIRWERAYLEAIKNSL